MAGRYLFANLKSMVFFAFSSCSIPAESAEENSGQEKYRNCCDKSNPGKSRYTGNRETAQHNFYIGKSILDNKMRK
jgi:hypothetical protein